MGSQDITSVCEKISRVLATICKDRSGYTKFCLTLTNPGNGYGETVVLEPHGWNRDKGCRSKLPTIPGGVNDIISQLHSRLPDSGRSTESSESDIASIPVDAFSELVEKVAEIAVPMNEYTMLSDVVGYGRGPAFQIIITNSPASSRLQLWNLAQGYGSFGMGNTTIIFTGTGETVDKSLDSMISQAQEHLDNAPLHRCPTCGHASVSKQSD